MKNEGKIGKALKQLLKEKYMSQAELALRMGRPQKTISEIINGKSAITPETAIQFEYVLGVSASYWNKMQKDYDVEKAEQKFYMI